MGCNACNARLLFRRPVLNSRTMKIPYAGIGLATLGLLALSACATKPTQQAAEAPLPGIHVVTAPRSVVRVTDTNNVLSDEAVFRIWINVRNATRYAEHQADMREHIRKEMAIFDAQGIRYEVLQDGLGLRVYKSKSGIPPLPPPQQIDGPPPQDIEAQFGPTPPKD